MAFHRILNRRHLSALTFVLFSLPACSLKSVGVRTTAEILTDGIASFEAEGDVTLARESAASQIKLLEALHRAEPDNRQVLLSLPRALGSYAFGFLEREAETDPAVRERAAALYLRGARYGFRLIGLDETASLEEWRRRLDKAGRKEVPALFWTGYCWGGAIRKNVSSPSAVAELPKAVALVERVLALDPDYYFGAPRLFMGVYYADRPRMAGGDPIKARDFFTTALASSEGRYVMGKYLYARYGAVALQDLPLFKSLLEEVANSPADLLPAQRLSQEIARSWARDLLAHPSNFFAEE